MPFRECLALCVVLAAACLLPAADTIVVDTPLSPPAWAVMERELIAANTVACEAFYRRYFDSRGFLECVERWGGDDGPDDAIENVNDWPLLHALGAPDTILQLYKKAWEGHLRQYTLAKTVDVPMARDGMYYKEFPVTFDWLHNGEGLTVFNLQGLSDPGDQKFQQRVRRYAGFYMNEDPGAPDYDSQHKIIRSLFNGSRGPLMRKATALDWAGDPIEVEHRFQPGHGERNYREMLEHFKEYTDIVGDHPQNLLATSLALNAYMLTREDKYRDWLVEYVDAWQQRAAANGNILPSNIGLDGKIGGSADGKWYGGVYGWGFTVTDPVSGKKVDRNTTRYALTGLGNALLLTGDQRYVETWRKQLDAINAQAKRVDGKMAYPTMYGDQGWYGYKSEKYATGVLQMYYWSMDPADRARVAEADPTAWQFSHNYVPHPHPNEWLAFLEGKNPKFPEVALRQEFATIRRQMARIRADKTTPDTRLADDPMVLNPACVTGLLQLTLGGIHPGRNGSPLHCRLRYFDPIQRRAGLPDGVAALVEKMTATSTTVTLVNVNQTESRTLVVQGGGYGEHQFVAAKVDGKEMPLYASQFQVQLEPGAGATFTLETKRYANRPTMLFPWNRST